MPDSLINEFIARRNVGEAFGSSLKESIFQAKSSIGEHQALHDPEAGPPFKLWKLNMRPVDDDEPRDWWVASTAVPIFAAAFGPLANVASIAALVTPWRMELPLDTTANDGTRVPQLMGIFIHDPAWCYYVNLVSLILGFLGNFFLLLNFTGRMRFLIALPLSISFWFISCGFLIGDIAAVHIYSSPIFPEQAYTGGFWYALAAAAIYLILMVGQLSTLLGYLRGHFPQHFELSSDQQTLIVQTMLYFIWLAGGAGVYSKIEGWHFTDALYWSAVTLLTVGYGDLAPITTAGRCLLVPYSFIGILILGLVISSIFKSVTEMGEKNIERNHYEKQRMRTVGRTVTSSLELERREIEIELAHERSMAKAAARPSSRSPGTFQNRNNLDFLLHRKTTFEEMTGNGRNIERRDSLPGTRPSSLKSANTSLLGRQVSKGTTKKERILLLREEKERFEAMRGIQKKTEAWKRWMRLSIILTIFALFWLVGACVFWQAEIGAGQDLTYGNSIYYSWVTLITIGFGDISPKSVAGRTFFVIWVEFAVPAVTILAQSLTSTVVSAFNDSSNAVTFALFAQVQVWQNLLYKFPRLFPFLPAWLRGETPDDDHFKEKADSKGKEKDSSADSSPNLNALAEQHNNDLLGKIPDAAALARQLALAIKRAARDMTLDTPRQYGYEEWVEFTRLIRFSAVGGPAEALKEEEDEGLVEWDWLAENSPMMAQENEAEFVLERLCESLVRYLRRNPPRPEFSDRIKEQGESALRLKSGGFVEDSETTDQALQRELSAQRQKRASASDPRSLTGLAGPVGPPSGLRARDLHPVTEEEH